MKEEAKWYQESRADKRWRCNECYLLCGITSESQPTGCLREFHERFNNRYQIHKEKSVCVGIGIMA